MAVVFFAIIIIAGLGTLFFVSNLDSIACKYIHVPDGESWKQVYRNHRNGKRAARPSWAIWVVIGGGLGVAAVAGLVALLS
jgi:hypothetical protein